MPDVSKETLPPKTSHPNFARSTYNYAYFISKERIQCLKINFCLALFIKNASWLGFRIMRVEGIGKLLVVITSLNGYKTIMVHFIVHLELKFYHVDVHLCKADTF